MGSHDAVVNAVAAMTIDAGTVRTDTLERMAGENSDQVKLISKSWQQKTITRISHFRSALSLYPEWPFAKLSHTSDTLAGKVVVALLRYACKDSYAAESAQIMGVDHSLSIIQKCIAYLQELQFGPFAQQTKEVVLTDQRNLP